MDAGSRGKLLIRQTDGQSGAEELYKLIQDPFNSSFQQESVWASLGTAIGFTVLIAITFSLLRPYNSVVYAPKLKHADDEHAPPPMGKGLFAWVSPVLRTKEQDLIQYVGLDATVFLRFTRMCRNMFLVITVIGCGILIPVNLSTGLFHNGTGTIAWLTPVNVFGQANWGQVVCAWLFNAVVAGFLWWNYRKVLQLRIQYFESPEYQKSLHARTLMIHDLPKEFRSDEGIGKVIDEVAPTSSFSRAAIARNVKVLPELIEQHDHTVRKLEKFLAKYLRNPDNLPSARPECQPSKKDPSYASFPKGQKVDAIEYLSNRIQDLENEIREVRLTLDKRNAMPYGFASYEQISEAHSIAFSARKQHPHGTTIVLAPRPNDVIWNNMPLGKSTRKSRRTVNNFWVALLTVAWIAPNAMISIFLVNLANLGHVWNAFQNSLAAHTSWWALVQGVASPALTSLIFLLLPIVFRRMSIRAGDQTKTARERHVAAKLYGFFVFNNLVIFSLFSVVWSFVSAVISKTNSGQNAWEAIKQADFGGSLFISLCNTSTFWVTWLLQRNLGAAVDLAQLWTLMWSFCARKFSNPTPRELIELTAPQAFDYASYYNYFLFYATVTLCFATIQPLVLPAAALYFSVDVYLKKYLLLYIFITKTESGGMFWRVVFNRMVFATCLANLIVFLAVWVHGDGQHAEAFAIIPLPFLMIAFKVYCRKTFDNKIHYYSIAIAPKDAERGDDIVSRAARSDRLASRYGHPALYKPLITPMVHARAQNILASIYRGRLTDSNTAHSGDMTSVSGYSDTYALDPMKPDKPGRSQSTKNGPIPGFEMVPESRLDFSYYKNRAEFGDDHGGEGQLFNRPTDLIARPGTADTLHGGYSSPGSSRAGSPAPGQSSRKGRTTMSPKGFRDTQGDLGANRFYSQGNGSETGQGLVGGAAAMPVARPGGHTRDDSLDARAPGFLGGGPQGYGGLPQHEVDGHEPVQDPTSYDYFRASRRQNAGWQGWTG